MSDETIIEILNESGVELPLSIETIIDEYRQQGIELPLSVETIVRFCYEC